LSDGSRKALNLIGKSFESPPMKKSTKPKLDSSFELEPRSNEDEFTFKNKLEDPRAVRNTLSDQ
jgi:hypothetical protein